MPEVKMNLLVHAGLEPSFKDLIDRVIKVAEELPEELSLKFVEAFEGLIDSGQCFLQLTSFDLGGDTTDARDATITLYPSERFLMLASAVLTGKFESFLVEDSHGSDSVLDSNQSEA